MHSRNRRAGILIGKGATAQEAMKEVGAIGRGLLRDRGGLSRWRSRQGVVHADHRQRCMHVLYGGMPAQEAIKHLLNRPRRGEHEEVWVH